MSGIATSIRSPMTRRLERHRPLSGLTTFRIGGEADCFLDCRNRLDVQEIAEMCRQGGIELKVIGGGSNLLIPDEGVRGMVIDISAMKTIRSYATRVAVDAGAKLSTLVARTARAGLKGLEGLAAIPGTVGGAIAMNAGGRYGEIGDCVERVVVLSKQGEFKQLSKDELQFGYRSSKLKGGIVVEVFLKLERGRAEDLLERVRKVSRDKLITQPYDMSSAGCTFRNPAGCEHSAGKLIELCGFKGESVGQAQVSDRHANFIVNLGEARSEHVLRLISRMKERVYGEFGVELKQEVKYWAA